MKQIDNGEQVDLTKYFENLSRRAFLKSSSMAALGSLALPEFVQRTYGAVPEGKTIVQTRDKKGRPAVVESVAPERYRRLKAYEYFQPGKLQTDNIGGATIRQRSADRTDLVIEIGVSPSALSKDRTRSRSPSGQDLDSREIAKQAGLPKNPHDIRGMNRAFSRSKNHLVKANGIESSVKDIPIEYTIGSNNGRKQALEGGSTLDNPTGTAGLVCYNDYCSPVLLTAYHVPNEGSDDPSQFSVEWNSHKLDDIAEYDRPGDGTGIESGQDAITFHLSGEVDAGDYDLLGTHSSIPDISGYWTFEGMSNSTSGDWIGGSDISPAHFHGAKSGTQKDAVHRTKKYTEIGIGFGAVTNNKVTDYGDSGGPWVDEDGNLFGIQGGFTCGTRGRSILSVAGPALDAVNATLSQDYNQCM